MIAGVLDTSKATALDPVDAALTKTRELLSLSDAEDLPIGLGFITFHASAPKLAQAAASLLKKHRPAMVWLFAPSHPSPHTSILKELRQAHPKLKLAVQVGDVASAREAVKDGADIICAQGVDAGGHQWAQGAGVISIVPEVADLLAKEFPDRQISLWTAGGIVDGRGVAAALTLGADAVVMGTRFVASKECPIKENVKQVYVQTTDGGTTTLKSTQFDDIRGTGFWPSVYDGRGIITTSMRDLQAGVSLDEVQKRFKQAADSGDNLSRAVIWSGTGVGMINEILPAGEIVKQVQADARRVLQEAAL